MRLKADILAEAQQFGNRILVMHENEDLSLFDHWEVGGWEVVGVVEGSWVGWESGRKVVEVVASRRLALGSLGSRCAITKLCITPRCSCVLCCGAALTAVSYVCCALAAARDTRGCADTPGGVRGAQG